MSGDGDGMLAPGTDGTVEVVTVDGEAGTVAKPEQLARIHAVLRSFGVEAGGASDAPSGPAGVHPHG